MFAIFKIKFYDNNIENIAIQSSCEVKEKS